MKKASSSPPAPAKGKKPTKGEAAYAAAKSAQATKAAPPKSALEVGREEQAKKKAQAAPAADRKSPAALRDAVDILDEASHLAEDIRELLLEEQDLSEQLRDCQKRRKEKSASLNSVLLDRATGQGRLPFSDAGAPGKIEALAFATKVGQVTLRVESHNPGEWSVLIDGVSQAVAHQSAAKAQAAALAGLPDAAQAILKDSTAALLWQPDAAWQPPKDPEFPIDTRFVAFDGSLKLTALQTVKGKWTVRDQAGRPLAIDLPLSKAQKAAAEELNLRNLKWSRLELDAPATPATETQSAIAKDAAAKVPAGDKLFDEPAKSAAKKAG